MSERVVMSIGDRRFDGWTSVKISDSLESEAPEFMISVSDRGGRSRTVRDRPIQAGQRCVVHAGDDLVVTGFVDGLSFSISSDSHSMTVNGAGITADLVDASALRKGGQYRGYTLDAIAEDICKPFGIPVIVNVDTGAPFPEEQINPGEKAAEFLGRLAAKRGVLAYGDSQGNLVIGRMEKDRVPTVLSVENGHILTMSAEISQAERFSEYIVRTQMPGSDHMSGGAVAAVEGRAEDRGVGRYRPLLIVGESAGDRRTAEERAAWERRIRIGKGIRAQVEVQGWRRPDGVLWRKGVIVPVDIPVLPSRRDLVVSGVGYSIDNKGARTSLTLVPVDALEPQTPERERPSSAETSEEGERDGWGSAIGRHPPEWSGRAGR